MLLEVEQTVKGLRVAWRVVIHGIWFDTMPNGGDSPKGRPAVTDDPPARKPQPLAPHTAVIYFHGMGSQRRLEETSRIIDSLDNHGHNKKLNLFDVTCHIEPSRVAPGETVQFIRTALIEKPGVRGAKSSNPRTPAQVHFYEGYWAPITATGVKPWTVFWWLLKQAFRPFVMLNSDWRRHARLRRSALRELHQVHRNLGKVLSFSERVRRIFWGRKMCRKPRIRLKPSEVRILLKEYKSFEGLQSRRDFPNGAYTDFRKYLGERLARKQPSKPSFCCRLQRAADAWKDHAFDTELRNLLVLWTMMLFILVASLTGITLVSWFLSGVTNSPIAQAIADLTAGKVSLQSNTFHISALTGLGFVVTLLGLPMFLRRFLGDVVFWCTYEETDVRFKKRREILDFGVKVVKHVLRDPQCKRVVVLAHSLGTAIAHDVLLELGKDDWARTHNRPGFDLVSTDELNKIEHFVTAGSPIDKVHYFFESDPGPSHRYTRVSDTIRGDMGRKPFSNNDRPFLHWINFWDKADIISGSLESPPNATDINVLVDNFEVSNGTILPGSAHTTYFENDEILDKLSAIIYKNEFSYRVIDEQSSAGAKDRPYASQNIGRTRPGKRTRLIQAFVMLIPWITFVYLVGYSGVAVLSALQR